MTVTILQGGALSGLLTLPSESVQCVVTSPPYFQLRDYGMAGQIGLESTPAAFIEALMGVFGEVRRVLRSDGVCFVNLGDSYAGSGKGPTGHNGIGNQERRQGFVAAPKQRGGAACPKTSVGYGILGATSLRGFEGIPAKSLMLIPERFAIAMQDAGWIVRSRIAWCKRSAMPESVKDRPTGAWEHIWMFTRSRAYFWDFEAARQPQTGGTYSRGRGSLYAPKITTPGLGIKNNGSFQAAMVEDAPADGLANMRNYWVLSSEPNGESHYAGFPTELPRRCIKAASRPGDTVLDPFLGSGTTALVADQLGRHAIGIELNPRYVEMARRRIESDAPMVQEPVSVATPTQVGMFESEAS